MAHLETRIQHQAILNSLAGSHDIHLVSMYTVHLAPHYIQPQFVHPNICLAMV